MGPSDSLESLAPLFRCSLCSGRPGTFLSTRIGRAVFARGRAISRSRYGLKNKHRGRYAHTRPLWRGINARSQTRQPSRSSNVSLECGICWDLLPTRHDTWRAKILKCSGKKPPQSVEEVGDERSRWNAVDYRSNRRRSH